MKRRKAFWVYSQDGGGEGKKVMYLNEQMNRLDKIDDDEDDEESGEDGEEEE